MNGNVKNLLGMRFGKWTVIARSSVKSHDCAMWDCRCECGTTRVVQSHSLLRGKSQSCGCGHAATHGMCKTGTYHSWVNMLQRCCNPKHHAYKNYGGRGITVCEAFRTFEGFYAALGDRPHGKSLDRIDNSGNYEPGNVRWATRSEQAQNKRPTLVRGENHYLHKLTDNDVRAIRKAYVPYERGSAAKLAEYYGVSRSAITQLAARRIWKHVP